MESRTLFEIQQSLLSMMDSVQKVLTRLNKSDRKLQLLGDQLETGQKQQKKQQSNLTDTLESINRKLKDESRGKYKPKVHSLRRAQMLLLADYVIPDWDQNALDWVKRTDKGEHGIFKWVGTNVEDIVSLDQKRKIVMPKLFPVFLNLFLGIPQNCCFHRMGQRLYYCCSDQDKWETFDNGVPEYWGYVRKYLWHCYGEFWEKLASTDDSCYVHDIKETVTNKNDCEIPLNIYGLKQILYSPQPHGHGHIILGSFLQKAFLTRNTNRKY